MSAAGELVYRPWLVIACAMLLFSALSESATAGCVCTDATVEIRAVVLDQESGLDTTTSVPTSVSDIVLGADFYVEIWAQQNNPAVAGFTCVYTDVDFDNSLVNCQSLVVTPEFDFQLSGTCGASAAVDVGGCNLVPDDLGKAPQWVRTATITFNASASGFAVFSAGPATNPVLVSSIHGCGSVCLADMTFVDGSVTIGPSCADDTECDDGEFCNGAETCVANACVAGTAINCNDGIACTVDSCDEALDDCDNTPDDALCDDSLFCTGVETCDAVTGCSSAGDPCTGQLCSEVTDTCVDCFDDTDCDDGLVCNGIETCVASVCLDGAAVNCDDGIVCTIDSCLEPSGSCSNLPSDVLCDDEDTCTDDVCSAMFGCSYSHNTSPCDDGDACTMDDTCSAGVCNGPAVDCTDTNPCTLEFCDTIQGCLYPNSGDACDDGLNCTENDTCIAGGCVGVPLDCNDDDPCTADSCDEVIGCQSLCGPIDVACDAGVGPNSGLCDGACGCSSSQSCVGDDVGPCCDLDMNNIRDDNCLWCTCDDDSCVFVPSVFADMGGAFGSCPVDNFANVHDRNLALACFAGSTTCNVLNVDAGGPFGTCPPDGFCNVHDANHALAAFGGTTTCGCPSGPAPEFGNPRVGHASVRARADLDIVRSGRRVDVRVFIDGPVEALRSYQLETAVSGGIGGFLDLVDIRIEQRKGAAFAQRSDVFSAFNIDTQQMLAGLEADTGVAVRDSAYLATFTYQASKDARGEFVIDVLTETWDHTVMVAPTNGEIVVTRSTPAIVQVSNRRIPRGR
jgi:hypothetical protein